MTQTNIDIDPAWVPAHHRHGRTCRDRRFHRWRASPACTRRGAASRRNATASVAADETYWREIQQAFTLDRTIINLNNGGCCPSPRVVHEAFKRYLDISNQAPVYHMWQILEPNIESVRRRLAARVRLRSRGARHHAQRQRGAPDRPARHRPQAGRRSRDDQPGLRADARHLGAARAPRRNQADEDLVPGPAEVAGRPRRSADRRDHAGDEGAALLPHHEPHRADLPGQADLRRSAAPRRQDRRRRRARLRALSRTRRAISAATSTARACTSGCWRRSALAFSTCAGRTSRRCGR